jgi:uncharacterized protein (TIGR02647 family)
MPIPKELMQEMTLLAQFNLATTQEGIKIHKDAQPEIKTAAQSLHAKGLIDQQDGGYLTRLGQEAAEHVQAALTILKV